MKRLLAVLATATLAASAARADLAAGDISILGFRSDADDAFAFVTWQPLAEGASIFFTDHGAFDDGTWRSSENTLQWTAPVGGLVVGTVVLVSCPDAGASADVGTVTGNLNGLSSSGDQIFAGSAAFPTGSDTTKPGESYSGTLIYGLNFDGSSWAADSTSSSTSYLPPTLAGSYGNFALSEIDNSQYTGARTGMTVSEFKAAIHNPANWTGSDDGSGFGALNSGDFAVVPEPGSAALLGAAGLLMLAVRRRRPTATR